MGEKIWSRLELNRIVPLIIIHVLDFLLLLVLLPFMVWEWIAERDHVKTMLRAIVEVTLELAMWITFAGVSILTTAFFILNDINHGQEFYGYQRKDATRVTAVTVNKDKISDPTKPSSLDERTNRIRTL